MPVSIYEKSIIAKHLKMNQLIKYSKAAGGVAIKRFYLIV